MGAPLQSDRIVVTATGIISALGTGRQEHAARLVSGSSGLRHPEVLTTVHSGEFVVGEVAATNVALLQRIRCEDCADGYTRTALLSMCALQDMLREVPLDWLQQTRLAFVNANTVGGMSEIESRYYQFLNPSASTGQDLWMDALDCAESTEQVARCFGLKPRMATISTACSSSANAMIVAARMLHHGLADAAIAGGGDALARYTLNGFYALKNVAHQPCRPFDRDRAGLNLGEGAGYLLLEREGSAHARSARVLAVLSGWCNGNDAYHPTAPAPDGSGALRAMQGALASAGLAPGDIGYINAHGTATENNDVAEGRAIEALWAGHPPPFSSTKPFTGHTLAAAGAVESILSIAAMRSGFIPPNLGFESRMEELSICPSAYQQDAMIEHVMSNSFGFGGNNVSLIFSKP